MVSGAAWTVSFLAGLRLPFVWARDGKAQKRQSAKAKVTIKPLLIDTSFLFLRGRGEAPPSVGLFFVVLAYQGSPKGWPAKPNNQL
jgi:hypothetical protein